MGMSIVMGDQPSTDTPTGRTTVGDLFDAIYDCNDKEIVDDDIW